MTITELSIGGSDAGNYVMDSTEGLTTADVTVKGLTITANSTSKIYGQSVTFDGTEFSTLGLVNGDSVTSLLLQSDGATSTASVAGSPYEILASDAVGSGLGNYSIEYLSGTLSVSRRALMVSATGVNKIYDGTFAATVNLSTDKLSGDSVTATYTTATFGDKNVGTAEPVLVSGIAISGADADNYSLQSTQASTSADITTRPVTVSALPESKVYGTPDPVLQYEITSGSLVPGDLSRGGPDPHAGRERWHLPNPGGHAYPGCQLRYELRERTVHDQRNDFRPDRLVRCSDLLRRDRHLHRPIHSPTRRASADDWHGGLL